MKTAVENPYRQNPVGDANSEMFWFFQLVGQASFLVAKNCLLWFFQIANSIIFLTYGSAKIAGNPQMIAMFSAIGVGQWFRYLTGVLEITSAILMLIPSLASVGGVLLICTTAGCALFHLAIPNDSPTNAIIMLVVNAGIIWCRHDVLKRSLNKEGFWRIKAHLLRSD